MKTRFTDVRAYCIRPLLAATFGLALALTFSCSSGDDGPEPSSSPSGNQSSSTSNGSGVSSSSGTSSSSSLSSSSSQAIVPVYGDPITDSRDGKTYETVVIGTQTWMAKNLDYETDTGSKCQNNTPISCMISGRLYNWEAAMTACPAGWHLPSDMEWVVLEDFIGGTAEAVWKKLRAKSGWAIASYNGTDNYGFSALPADGNYSYWWSSTENRATSDLTIGAYYRDQSGGYSALFNKSNTFSVRCLKGSSYIPPSSPSYNPVSCPSIPSGSFCDDRDGKVYKSVSIDGKTWMAENLAFNAKGSVCCGEGEGSVCLTGLTYNKCSFTAQEIQTNCAKYGKLYNWAVAMALEPACNRSACASLIAEKHKGICPKGWHVPRAAEWNELVASAGGSSTAGYALKATNGWTGNVGNGADLLGFSALPGGYGSYIDETDYDFNFVYYNIGSSSEWWSSSESDSRSKAPYWSLNGGSNGEGTASVTADKSYLRSLRCVKD